MRMNGRLLSFPKSRGPGRISDSLPLRPWCQSMMCGGEMIEGDYGITIEVVMVSVNLGAR